MKPKHVIIKIYLGPSGIRWRWVITQEGSAKWLDSSPQELAGPDEASDQANAIAKAAGWIVDEEIIDSAIPGGSALAHQEGGDHYKAMAIQPVEYIHRNGLGFCEGNVVKYVTRWKEKNGIEDLKKAKHYIELLIEMASGK